MYKIVFSPAAVDDLLKTKKYITEELGSEQSAINTVAKITEKIGQLSEIPFSGPSLSSIINIETSYRFLVCGNYTAFYRLVDNEVQIIRVLYGRRNFMQILFGEMSDE